MKCCSRRNLPAVQRVAVRKLRQRRRILVRAGVIVRAFHVQRAEACELHHRPARPEQVLIVRLDALRVDVNPRGVEQRVGHLARQHPLPYQVVQPELLAVKVLPDILRRSEYGSGAYRLVRFLRALHPLRIGARRLGRELRSELVLDVVIRLFERGGGDIRGVGTPCM